MQPERRRELYLVRPLNSTKAIPEGEHWAVIIHKTQSLFIPGDERSRTNPGHGYPEHTETVETMQYFPFQSKELAAEYVEYLVDDKYAPTKLQDIRVLHVNSTVSPRLKVALTL